MVQAVLQLEIFLLQPLEYHASPSMVLTLVRFGCIPFEQCGILILNIGLGMRGELLTTPHPQTQKLLAQGAGMASLSK